MNCGAITSSCIAASATTGGSYNEKRQGDETDMEVTLMAKHLVTQDSKVPTRKVSATALAGSLVTIGVAIAQAFDVGLEPELVAAITTLVSFIAGYFIRDRA